MKILISRCLLGVNCKYNGKNNYSEKLMSFLEDKEYVDVCPELLALEQCPRAPIELVNGKAIDCYGNDVDEPINRAIEEIVSNIEDIDLAILQSRSPTCGVNQIYDGTFTGRRIKGQGKLAKRLKEMNIKVLDIEDLEDYIWKNQN